MPPTLRSAQSSPTKETAFDLSPGITPGRKAPQCTKCGQPRLGHPRSGCSRDTSNGGIDTSPTKAKSKTLQENLSQALGSMYLETSTAPMKQPAVQPRHGRYSIGAPPLQTSETLISISTSAEDMLQDLTKPGFFSQATVTDDKGSKEQESTVYPFTPSKLKIKSGPQTLMPGTLMAPSWESSIDGLPEAERTRDSPEKSLVAKNSLGIQTSFIDRESDYTPSSLSNSQPSLPSSQTSIPTRRLQKSQTQEQRELFLSSLSQVSPASVYVHKKDGVDAVLASARGAKLHIRIIESDDKDEEDILLVIGSEFRAVEKLADELAKSIKNATPATGTTTNNYYIAKGSDDKSSSSTFKAVASGAIVGVVGTWAGLAFS